jgi:RES domain-containing protein
MFVVENKYLTLKAPSAVVQGEFNFLINPNHSHFPKIKLLELESFEIDNRLFKTTKINAK